MNRATAEDVARRAGVSRSTVSFVLNNVPGMRISPETRQRVLRAALELDYHPDAIARLMVTGQSKLLGFVLVAGARRAGADVDLADILHGLSHAAAARGYQVILVASPAEHSSGALTAVLRERRVDGFVLLGPQFDDLAVQQLQATGVPLVQIGHQPDSDVPFVAVDQAGGARAATEHLLEAGRRRIALLTPPAPADASSAERMDGYRQALLAAGVAYDDQLVRYADLAADSGRAAMDDLLSAAAPPQAVFATSDILAAGALRAIHRRHLCVPKDIAVVGFDDLPLAQFMDPPLTSIRVPAYELGRAAGDMLTRLLAKEPVERGGALLPTQLVGRESTLAKGAGAPVR